MTTVYQERLVTWLSIFWQHLYFLQLKNVCLIRCEQNLFSKNEAGPHESREQPRFCTVCILAGYDDIKMWALLLNAENWEAEHESNICFQCMNTASGTSRITWHPDKGNWNKTNVLFLFFCFSKYQLWFDWLFVKESFLHSVIHTHWKVGKGHYHSSEKILRGRRRAVFFSRRCQRCRRSCICVRQKPSHGCWQCPDLCRLSGIHMLHVQTSTDWIEQ